jgi:hypothetical protein
MKSSRHVKRRLKSVRELKNSGVITLDYVQTAKNLADPFTKGVIKEHDRPCIKGDGFETHMSCRGGNPTYVIGDPLN